MPKKTRIKIDKIKLGIILLIFFTLQISILIYSKNISIEKENNQEIMSNKPIEQLEKTSKQEIPSNWQIEIEKISLKGDIAEGTDSNTLNKYIGHFENTQKENGNIGLAAHNRGYPLNYFSRLKELKEGDIIKYQYGIFEKEYEVSKNIIIKDTEWDKLENTEKNMITLITCVENEPLYRRCVQAVEIEKF